MAVEDVSRLFIVSTSLYILMSVSGSVLFHGEPFAALLLLAGLAVLIGSRLVLYRPATGRSELPGRSHRDSTALWLGVLAALLWSASLLLVSEAMESVEALTATAIRLPFMAVTLGLIAGFRGEYRRGFKVADIRPIASSGVLIVGAMTMFLLSAKLSSAGTVAVLTSTSPIFVAPLAHVFLNEKLTIRTVSGTVICMAGILLASL